MAFERLSINELVQGIRDTDQALIRASDMYNTLSKPNTLPHKQAAKFALLESTAKLIEALKEEERQLSAELARRGPNG
jgi:hypothetical protein